MSAQRERRGARSERVGGEAPLRALIVEDSPDDALLLVLELRRAGYAVAFERVEDPSGLEEALRRARERGEPWEIVLADYYLPRLRAPEALRILQEVSPETPFVVVSGNVGEEAAVELMRSGARDYVSKDNLARLAPVVGRELGEAAARREQERAERALKASEERYRTFVAQSTEGIWRMETERPIPADLPEDEQIELFYRHGYLAECNDAAARMYGHERAEDLIGARAHDLLPRSEPSNLEYLRACVRSGYALSDAPSVEVDRDGREKHFLNNLTGVIEDGCVVRIWGTQRDVTETREAEEALAQSENLYRSVVEQAAENIFLVDVETKRLLESNAALHASLGYTAEEMRSMTLYDLLGHDRESIDRNIDRVVRERRRFVGERRYLRKDGSVVDAEVSASVIAYGAGEAMCVVAHDVTERRRVEEEVKTRARQQALVAEIGRRALAETDVRALTDDAVRLVAETLGAEYCEVLELSPEEDGELVLSAGVGWDEAAGDPPSAGLRESAIRALGSGQALVVDVPREGRSAETGTGLEEYGITSGVMVVVQGEGPYGVLGVHCARRRDFAENDLNFLRSVANVLAAAVSRKRADEKLAETREAERRRIARDLHDGVLSDLVYALQGIQIRQALAGPKGDDEGLEETAEALRRSVEGLRSALFELRLGADLERSLVSSLTSLVQLNRRMARKEYEVELRVGEDPSERVPEEAAGQIVRIVQEALNNVRRHSGARRARVELEVDGDRLILTVSDDGRGFGPSDPVASGLGTSSMRDRARAIGGELEVRSAPGQGTTVAFEASLSALEGEDPSRGNGSRRGTPLP